MSSPSSPDQPGFKVMSMLDDETVPILGGSLDWVRYAAGWGSAPFGANAYRAASEGDAVIEEHVESPGQEELYVVLAGRARFVAGDESFDVAAGGAVFLSEPSLRRGASALEDGTVVLAVGGWPDQSYHSLPWEPIYLAQEAMRQGDWAKAAETLEREAGEHLDTAIVQFRLACCHARLGEQRLALAKLRRAIELNPGMRERAASEQHLGSLRELEDWPAALGG